jgi:hypothetical protein
MKTVLIKLVVVALLVTSLAACCPGCYRHGGGYHGGRGGYGGR